MASVPQRMGRSALADGMASREKQQSPTPRSTHLHMRRASFMAIIYLL